MTVSMNEEFFALGRRLLGLEPPPSGIRHFLPQVVGEFATGLHGRGLMFDGYDDANSARYVVGHSEGSCLEPDIPPACCLVAIDPQLQIRDGDIGALSIQVSGIKYECLKHIQVRNGRLWACSNDGDIPLTEHTQVVGRLVFALAPNVTSDATSRAYGQGFANLFAMLHDARVGEAGEGAILSTVGSTVPAVSGAAARALDPYQREIYSMLDEFKSKIPGLSKTLPPRRNLWGEPIPSGHDPVTNFISPVKIANVKHEPIDDEILKQGFNIEMPDTHQTFGGRAGSVAIDMRHYPAAYSRLLQLSGNELEHPAWGVGLKDLLNSIVSGTHPLSGVYNLKSDGPEGGKEVMVRDLISQYRDLAKNQLLQEYPALAQKVQDKQDARQALKLGAVQ